jgi:ribonuclease D
MHKVRDRRALNAIKNLWHARDSYAQEIDVAPGRIFNDETMMELINKKPDSVEEFAKILMKRTRHQDLPAKEWFSIYEEAFAAADSELPPMRGSGTGLPAIKIWESKNPLGYARATHIRARIIELASEYGMPPENLISPDAIKKLCWNEPPASGLLSHIESTLRAAGARTWQVGLIASHLEPGMRQTTPLKVETPPTEEGISQQ